MSCQVKPGAEVAGGEGLDLPSPPPGVSNVRLRQELIPGTAWTTLSCLPRFLAQSKALRPPFLEIWAPCTPNPISASPNKSPGIPNPEAENREEPRVLPPY